MSVGELLKRKDELLSQYRVLGVPTESELQASENVVYVHAYTKEDGTEVKSHYRSKSDGNLNNNFSTESTTGGASKVDSTTPTLNGSVEVNKQLYPDEIAGVKRGKPRTFEEAVRKGVNPNYEEDVEDELNNKGSNNNCNSCVAAYEYLRRGYEVNAGSTKTNEKAEELSHNGLDLWIDPETDKIADWTEIDIDKESSYDYIKRAIKPEERYELGVYSKLEDDDGTISDISRKTNGHAIVIEKDKNNELRIYDPQSREVYINNKEVEMYLDAWIDNQEVKKSIKPKIIRIDNKKINPYYTGVLIQ